MDQCVGDSCDQAIEIDAGAPGIHTYEGELAAYVGDIDAGAIASCAGLGAPSTPGAERIYRISNVSQGQTIQIAANIDDDNDDAILVMRGCGQAAECVDYKELGDRLTWTAQEAGDYTIVVDNLDELNQPFKHVITVQ